MFCMKWQGVFSILFCVVINSPSAQAASDANVIVGDPSVACAAKLADLNNACGAKTLDATNSCDDSQNSGLAQAQQVAVALGQSVSASIEAACSAMGKISQAANAATAAYQMSCQSSVSDCTSACNAALQYYNTCTKNGYTNIDLQTAIKDSAKTCTSLQAKANQAQQAIQNVLQTAMQAQNCASLSSGTSAAATDFCVSNPNLAGCTNTVVDCSSAEMATNKVCVCAKNPNDPSCAAATSVSDMSSSAPTATRTTASDASDIGDLGGTPEITQAPLNKTATDPGIDGKQGSGTSFSSNGADFGSSDNRASGKSGANSGDSAAAIGSGFYGSGGGSGSSVGGSSSGQNENPYIVKTDLSKETKSTADLRKFLPGAQFAPKAQGIAGSTGVDGITGPNSDIWLKVKNRYQIVTPSLIP